MSRPFFTARPTLAEERQLQEAGFHLIAGVDEVGRGPLAGPVVAGAVILDTAQSLDWYGRLRDSKALSASQRERLDQQIRQEALAFGLGSASPEEIDSLGIAPASRMAMARAVSALAMKPDHLLVDAVPLREAGIPFRSIIHGDALSMSIAASSIVAKVFRDQHMLQEDASYPGYGFARHKGYPTQEHMECLARLGPCPIHRRSFAPVTALIQPVAETSTPPISRRRGRLGEDAAVRHLQARGYQIVERNFTAPWGEVDVIAKQGQTLVFVEVKARRSQVLGTPLESVTPRKQQRLVLSAQEYLQRHGLESQPWRIDVIALRLGPGDRVESLQHLENAVIGF